MSASLPYRLAIDLGPTSIGWALLRLTTPADPNQAQPVALIKTGVRIFSDGRNPKDGSSLAVTRRLARQMRRRRDRLLKRKYRLLQALIELGFFPADPTARTALVGLDPYVLRARALDEPLTPAEFARALFHLNQRRGFKSNRKTDRQDSESGALKTAIASVREQLLAEGARTVGEWLARRHSRREGVRARLHGTTVKNRRYDLYIDRAMVADEFDAIWARQEAFQPALFHEAARKELRSILLFQRPLKPVPPGRCTLLPDEYRAPMASPLTQRFRIYQEVNNLRLVGERLQDSALTLEQRDRIVQRLEAGSDLTFAGMRRLLRLPGTIQFNLEGDKRDRLKGNATSRQLSRDEYFGPPWHDIPDDEQETIVDQLLNEENPAALIAWLQVHASCDPETAERLVEVRLPEGYGRLSVKALKAIVPELREAVITYDKAVEAAGLSSHSGLSHAERTGEIMPALPYYGEHLQRHVAFGSNDPGDPPEKRFGRIANPTVHIGLNQVRTVVNALIARYGHPSQVVVEVARELKVGRERRLEIEREQAKRQQQNTLWRDQIRPLIGGGEPNRDDLQKMRLWVELDPRDAANRRCPYTGKRIGMEMLFSDAVEIDHILPFSRTLDDSLNNKTVCLRRANRDKNNRTPFEAFEDSPAGYDYDEILARASFMPREKARRFAPDGYTYWLREEKDFLARALNDTAYLARIAKEYLTLICPPNQVWVTPGRLTAMLRGKYGLNTLLAGSGTKNRNDHRHHAIDAAVIGITDRGLLKRFADANQQARERGLNRLVEHMPEPWPRFREQVAHAIAHIWVSHRPDHSYEGSMMEETAWGLRPDGLTSRRVREDDGGSRVETRRQRVIAIADPQATHRHGSLEDGQPRPYKGYVGGSNFCIEISRTPTGRWVSAVISTFEAYQFMRRFPGEIREEGLRRLRANTSLRDGSPLVMRLHRNDTVRMIIDGRRQVWRVANILQNGQMVFAPHNEANVDARNRDRNDSFAYISRSAGKIQQAQARQVTISPIGAVHVRPTEGHNHARPDR